MFTSKHNVISGIMILTFYTCNYPGTHATKGGKTLADSATAKSPQALDVKKNNPGSKNSSAGPKDFLDSVYAKMNLSFLQVKQQTNIDTINYTGRVEFLGDTVWYRNSKHPLAIVRYGDKKLLLVFNHSGQCTASLIVGMDDDVDGFDSVVLNYKIFDNNSFSTTETWTYCGESGNDKITITKQFYQIGKKGNILAQNNIIHSFTRSKDLETQP